VDDYSICQACPHRGRKVRQVSTATGDTWLADCNQRRVCPRAARRYRLGIAERLVQAEWKLAITLTMLPQFRTVTGENIARQSAAWRTLQRELKRRHGLSGWAWIREQKRGGNLHLHALIHGEFTETELAGLARMAEKAGFGLIHLKRTSETKGGSTGAIGYTVKSLEYVASHPDGKWPPGTRLFRTSVPKLPGKRKGSFEERFAWIWNPSYEDGDAMQP
jgi:hypothetical protein